MSSQFSFEAIGTHWHIKIEDDLKIEQETNILFQVKNRIDIFDKAYSRFRDDSLVTEMSQKEGVYIMPDDAKKMIDLYSELYILTKGYFTPLIGQVLVDAGYDANYSLKQNKELQQPPRWEEIIEYHHPNLTIKKPVLLDFGAAGKGYLIDLVGEILKKNNIIFFNIDAGGDILHYDLRNTSISVGLENPNNFDEVIGVVELKNKSLCGSAGNRRKWQSFHHIIDPYKLSSPKEILATWVVAETALLADALATSLFLVTSTALTTSYVFDYLIVYADFNIEKSKSFPGEVFIV